MVRGLITIAIPTHNRTAQLNALLESIERNFSPEIDSVIVVDDSENFVDVTSKFPDLKVNHLRLRDRVFISRAKNIAWKMAQTKYVFFIDDDNVVEKETIPSALNAIESIDGAGAVMPAVLYKSKPDLVWVYAAPFAKAPPDFELLGRNLPRNLELEEKFYNTDALPNASIIRRDALVEIGGFNEKLVVNSSMDVALRLKRKSWKVYAYTGSFILHDVEPPGRLGWWAVHGWADPKRVRYEMRDWFIIMRLVRGREKLLTLRSILDSTRFVLPNSLAYVIRGKSRIEVLFELFRGYLEGIIESNSTQNL